jgi:crotonobetainyl-CoA:carnitine CoA-transferase CaiB-like acyl-CoA transferase
VFGPYNVLDYGTGTMAAFAAALGLYYLETTGLGQHAHTSLTQTGLYQQAWHVLRPAETAGHGPAALGPSPWQRFYQAADGWFFLGATDGQLPALRQVPGLAELDPDSGPERIAAVLAAAFRSSGAAEWTRRLVAVGVGAHPVSSLGELMTDPRARTLGLSVNQVSEEVGEVVMPGIAISVEGNPPRLGEAVRRPGADGREVLDQIGLGESADPLARNWAVQLDTLPPGWNPF